MTNSQEVEGGNVESASESDDDILIYSLADIPPVCSQQDIMMRQLGCDGHDERRAGDNFLSRSSTEIWLLNAPTARQARIENIIKGQPGPTLYTKQRVSADNSVVDSFFVFFCKRMLQHVVHCTSPIELSAKPQRNCPRSSTSRPIIRQKEVSIVLTR